MSRRILTVFLLALAFGTPGCQSEEARLATHLQRAEEYQQEGKPKEALIELRNALRIRPTDAEINLRIAHLMRREGKLPEALFFYQEAYRLDPRQTYAALAAASILAYEDPDAAEKLVREVLEREPDNAFAYVRLSEIALIRGDVQAAIQAALTAVELAPELPDAQMALAFAYQGRIREAQLRDQELEEEDYRKALAAFDRAVELSDPGSRWRILLNRAEVLDAWPGHREEALQTYREAAEAAFEHGDRAAQLAAVRALREAARAHRNPELQRWALERAIEADDSLYLAWLELALLADAQQVREGADPSEARAGEAILKQLLEKRPEDVQAHVVYARYLAARGRQDDAIRHLEQVAAEDVDPPVALGTLVDIAFQAGRLDKARAIAQKLRESYPDHPRTQLALAQMAFAEGRFEDAAALLRDATGRAELPDAYRLLAGAELRLGNLDAALAAIDRALELEPESVAALRLKLRIQAARRDWQGVLQALRALERQGVELGPNELATRAHALYGLGRQRRARQVLRPLLFGERVPVPAVMVFALNEMDQDPERVRKVAERALAQHPDDPRLVRILVDLDLKQGQPEQALARIDALARKGSLTPTLALRRARALAALGRDEEAEREALRVLQAAPQMTGVVELLVDIHQRRGDLAGAIASFEEAARAGALAAPARALLARLHLVAGDRDRARELLESVLAERADLPGAKNDLAYLLAEEGKDLDRALQLAQEARASMSDSPAVADTLGLVYLRKGLAEAAVEQFRTAIADAEASGEAVSPLYHYHLGLALRAAGREADAVAAFEKALAAGSSFAEAEDARRQLEEARRALAASAS